MTTPGQRRFCLSMINGEFQGWQGVSWSWIVHVSSSQILPEHSCLAFVLCILHSHHVFVASLLPILAVLCLVSQRVIIQLCLPFICIIYSLNLKFPRNITVFSSPAYFHAGNTSTHSNAISKHQNIEKERHTDEAARVSFQKVSQLLFFSMLNYTTLRQTEQYTTVCTISGHWRYSRPYWNTLDKTVIPIHVSVG